MNQLATQTLEEHTITLVLPSTEAEAASNYEQLKAEIRRLIASARNRHANQHLTFRLDESIELGEKDDLHIYQLQILA